jgi:DNA-binding transcriptional MerR regulator
LDPQFANKRKELETQLRNQGLSPQDAAWKSQFEGLGNQENDARNQALWSASGAGRDESNAMFTQMMNRNQNTFGQNLQANQQNYGQMMQGSQYANALRQQALTEQMQKRGFSLNEINALLSGQQVSSPQMPSFTGASQAAPAPIYQAGVDQGNFDQAAQQQMTDAITGAGKAAMMSDRRLKRNIRRVGTVNGYPWYTFEYIWGVPGQGVMADEVPAEFTIDIAGYKAVDYNRVLGV